jgi:hypothetical protein
LLVANTPETLLERTPPTTLPPPNTPWPLLPTEPYLTSLPRRPLLSSSPASLPPPSDTLSPTSLLLRIVSACRRRPSRPRRGRRGPPRSAASRGCSTSPTVLDRERTIVVNHEQIRCVITVGAMEERAWPDLASDLLMAGEGKKGGGAESRRGTRPHRRAAAAGR